MDGLWQPAAGHNGHDGAATTRDSAQSTGTNQEDAKEAIMIKLSVDAIAYLPGGSKQLIPSSSTILCPERTIISPIGVACDLVFEGNTICNLTSPGSMCLAGTGITMRRKESDARLGRAVYCEPERLPAGTILKLESKMQDYYTHVQGSSILSRERVLKGGMHPGHAGRMTLSHPIVLGAAGLRLSRNTTLMQDMVLAGDMLLGNETILPAAAVFLDTSRGVGVLDDSGARTVQWPTDIIPKGATLPALTILPAGTVLAAGTLVPGYTTLPAGAVLVDCWIPAGSVLPAGIRIRAGVRLSGDDHEYLQSEEVCDDES